MSFHSPKSLFKESCASPIISTNGMLGITIASDVMTHSGTAGPPGSWYGKPKLEIFGHGERKKSRESGGCFQLDASVVSSEVVEQRIWKT